MPIWPLARPVDRKVAHGDDRQTVIAEIDSRKLLTSQFRNAVRRHWPGCLMGSGGKQTVRATWSILAQRTVRFGPLKADSKPKTGPTLLAERLAKLGR